MVSSLRFLSTAIEIAVSGGLYPHEADSEDTTPTTEAPKDRSSPDQACNHFSCLCLFLQLLKRAHHVYCILSALLASLAYPSAPHFPLCPAYRRPLSLSLCQVFCLKILYYFFIPTIVVVIADRQTRSDAVFICSSTNLSSGTSLPRSYTVNPLRQTSSLLCSYLCHVRRLLLSLLLLTPLIRQAAYMRLQYVKTRI